MMSIFGLMIFGALGQTLFLDWASLLSGNITPQTQMSNVYQPSRNNVIASSSVVSLQEQRKHLVALTLSPPSPPDFLSPPILAPWASLPLPSSPTRTTQKNKEALFPYWDCCSKTPGAFSSALSPPSEPE